MNVSRETRGKLDTYLKLLRKWSPKINLVSSTSLKDAASRHFDDSMQVAALANPDVRAWVDLGSGGGFPGAVVAIVLSESNADLLMTLVESDQRKAAFLRAVSRETKTPFTVIAKRIEDIPSLQADIVSARALATVSDLCWYTEMHLKPSGKALFMKGENWKQEIEDARKQWRFTCEAHRSITNPSAAVLEIGDLSRA
jgi:16S rRNA (guanine527-N7)-methyltransferase